MTEKIKRNLLGILKKNSIPFCEYDRKLDIINDVGIHWFSLKRTDGKENFGDALSMIIVEKMLQKAKIPVCHVAGGHTKKHLFAVGSILFFGYQNCTVWGSGLLSSPSNYRKPSRYKMDIRAVRGPVTRESLVKNGFDCPEVYGDPAILLPLFYHPTKTDNHGKISVIPHKDGSTKISASDDFQYIDVVTDNVFDVIDKIANSRLVISSSLHGIIVAEAYGVPAILLKDYDSFDDFKYKDWYYSTGRYTFPVASSVSEAMAMQCPPVPDLEEMRAGLLKSFPYDIFYK